MSSPSSPWRQKYKNLFARRPHESEITFNLTPNATSSMEAPLIAASERFWACPYRGGGGPVFIRAHGAPGKVEPDAPVLNGHRAPVRGP